MDADLRDLTLCFGSAEGLGLWVEHFGVDVWLVTEQPYDRGGRPMVLTNAYVRCPSWPGWSIHLSSCLPVTEQTSFVRGAAVAGA
ncbi:hypothetical protein [Pilimelia anulata]|nr:hypothetical protein [Pilimelia anulata]